MDNYYPGGWLPKLSKDGYRVRVELLGIIDTIGMEMTVAESDLQSYLLRTQRKFQNQNQSDEPVNNHFRIYKSYFIYESIIQVKYDAICNK